MSFYLRDPEADTTTVGTALEWEETTCLLCAGGHASLLVEAADPTPGAGGLRFAVVQCQECGLCFTNPRPSAETIGRFYPSAYGPHRPPRPRRPRRRWFRAAPTWQNPGDERTPLPWHGQGRLLDFGCGNGTFVDLMARAGWTATGVDVCAASVHRIRTDLGRRALVGSLPHPNLKPASFDVVSMWHSLEHVHEPLELLRQAHRLLVPGGKLLVAVPNIDSLPFHWFGAHWYGLDLPRHLTHFTPWTLHLMLQKAGFRVGPIGMQRQSNWMRSSARLARGAGRAPGWMRGLMFKPFSRLAAWYCYLTRQSDCLVVAAER